MVPAEGVDAFFAAPAGTFMSGRSWIYFCVDEQLFGQIYWGRPEAADVEPLTALWQIELRPEAAPHDSYVDASGLEGMDPAWLGLMQREQEKNRAALGEKIRRQALVRPAGVPGALVAGFYGVVTPAFPVQVFAAVSEALDWLGRGELSDELVDFARTMGTHLPFLAELRRYLAEELATANLAGAAHGLHLSERTLQRRLREAGTSFQTELQTARVGRAKLLLAESDAKLTSVALEVGCASLQHFSSLFRQLTGLAPSEWRAARKSP